jgi:hypothetical protein
MLITGFDCQNSLACQLHRWTIPNEPTASTHPRTEYRPFPSCVTVAGAAMWTRLGRC